MKNKCLVLISQAHGKDTPGKRSPDGQFREWKWSREITKLIVEKLYKHGIKSVIINPEDEDIKLSVQAARANEHYRKNKDLYEHIILISPHVNAGPTAAWHDASGFQVYVYNKAGKQSRKLARIIADYAYDGYRLAGNRWIPSDKYFEANYAILRQTVMPAVLTENMFMTNHNDIAFLNSEEGKSILSDLHVFSILKYIDSLS